MKKVIVLSPVKLGSVIHKPGGKPLVLEDGIADQLIGAHLAQLSAVIERSEGSTVLDPPNTNNGSAAANTSEPGREEPVIRKEPQQIITHNHRPAVVKKAAPKKAVAKKAAAKPADPSSKP